MFKRRKRESYCFRNRVTFWRIDDTNEEEEEEEEEEDESVDRVIRRGLKKILSLGFANPSFILKNL